jgi:hypothetical protein
MNKQQAIIDDLRQWAITRSGQDAHQFSSEAQPASPEEAYRLALLRHLATTTNALVDLRDFAAPALLIFPAADYLVGTGSSHVYVIRRQDAERLAIIGPAGQGGKEPPLYVVNNHTGNHFAEVEAGSHLEAAQLYRIRHKVKGYAKLTTTDARQFLQPGQAAASKQYHETNDPSE